MKSNKSLRWHMKNTKNFCAKPFLETVYWYDGVVKPCCIYDADPEIYLEEASQKHKVKSGDSAIKHTNLLVGSCGLILFEAAKIKLPSILIVMNENQKTKKNTLEEK